MRRYYIDNLRTALVFLLIPFHTFMMYNNWGEGFYVYSRPLAFPSFLINMIWPWFMPALFTLAGISTAFSLEKRTVRQYVRERITRLFVPLVLGIIFVIPVQTYYAERFHNGYTGSYLAQYPLFFGKVTDLTGYTGGFTPGQLWFVLYLFVISLAAVPVIQLIRRRPLAGRRPFPLALVFTLGFAAIYVRPLLNIGGKSLTEYFWYFMLGYAILSKENVLERIERRRMVIGGIALALFVLLSIFFAAGSTGIFTSDEFFQAYAWSTILFLIGFFKQRMNHSGTTARYLARSSFAIYVLHQSVLVFAGFYILQLRLRPVPEMVLVVLCTVALTLTVYELWRRLIWKVRTML